MTKKHDLTAILEKHRKRADGIRISFYLSKSVYENFKKLCGDVSVSAVIEEWMREAVEAEKKK